MTEFWVSSGHLLLDRAPDGTLRLTDDFLRVFLARPELMPPPEACDAERALHARLLADPRAPADPGGLADADAAENWQVFLAFRDRLVAAACLEAAYLDLVRGERHRMPPLFLAQLTHVILRSALHDCRDALVVRAAELFFRPQRATWHADTILLADAEAIFAHEQARRTTPLLAMLGQETSADLTVLTQGNADTYWGRSDAFDMALDLGGLPSGRDALGRALEVWLRHMLGIPATIAAIPSITDADWRWFVGLDAEATRIGNALWRGETPDEAERLLALYALRAEPGCLRADLADQPVYLLLACGSDRMVRLKPQNLLVGLPLAERV